MEIFRAEGWGWPEYMIDLTVQLAFLALLVALTVWLWPNGIAEVPFSAISIADWFRAAASVFSSIATALAFYFIALELGMILARGTQRTPSEAVVLENNREI